VHQNGTGKLKGEELAPAIKLIDFAMSLDAAKSDIVVSGSWEYWITSKLISVFNKAIFSKLISEIKNVIPSTLETKINDVLYKHGSHYSVDGLGFDYSQMKKPEVSNDELLTIFFNGTFFSDDAQAGRTGKEIIETEHPNIDISSVSKQDLMLHMTESVATSLFNTVIANNGLNITGLYSDSFLKKHLHYDSVCWLNPVICQARDDNTPLNLYLYLSKVSKIKFDEGTILLEGSVRFVFEDYENLLGDYELEGVSMNMTVWSRPEYAQVTGRVNELKFDDQKILK